MFDHNNTAKRVIALGFFDGVHLGHQALLRRAVELSREHGLIPAVFTFDRAPKEFVTGKPVPLLTTVEERMAIIQALFPIQDIIVEPFDRNMMTMDRESFFRMLAQKYHAGWLVAGEDYTFGYKNHGNAAMLEELSRQYGIGCDIIPYVNMDGQRISSTHIRQLLQQGDMAEAERLLGHSLPFSARRIAEEQNP